MALPLIPPNKQLKLRLFGSFQLSQGQLSIKFRSNPERALMAYLAVESDQSHNREFLCDLIWPELDEEKARNNLRVTLSRLKKKIEGANQDSPVVSTNGQSIQLSSKEIWVDTLVFSDLLDQSRAHAHPVDKDCIECIERFRQAAELFRGELLKGFSLSDNLPFLEWTVVRRENFNRQAINIFYTLADYYLRRGKLDELQIFALRQLELEPWREEAHRQLMSYFAITDQKSAALAQFERCANILEKELGVTPSSDTQELYKRIRKSRKRKSPVLPVSSSVFVGRQQEQANIIETLSHPDCKLLTLVGIGGVGKTRLAVHITKQIEYAFLDGAIFVPLANIRSPDRLPDAIADALGFSFGGSREPFLQLLEYLENKEYLLVLDNFEHLLETSEYIEKIIKTCPDIKLLVTSRERLGLINEHLIELEGLPTTALEGMQESSAVELLTVCIRKIDPKFVVKEVDRPIMVELCQRVEGMPLALELVAPMTKVLSLHEILLDIETLEKSGLERVFDRSWNLLDPAEQSGLMKLSIFKSPFTHQDAKQVAQIDLPLFTSYIDKSLVRRAASKVEDENGQEVIFFDFHPLLKQFLYQKLIENPEALYDATKIHADYFLELLEQVMTVILTPDETMAMRKVHTYYEDVTTVMFWACENERYKEVRGVLQLFIDYFELSGAFREGLVFFGELVRILKKDGDQLKNRVKEHLQSLAMALFFYGWHLMRLGEYHEMFHCYNEAIVLARESQDLWVEGHAMSGIANAQRLLGDIDESTLSFKSAQEIYYRIEDNWSIAASNLNLGNNAILQSKYGLASAYFDTALDLFKEIGNYWGIANTLHGLANLQMKLDNLDNSKDLLTEGLELTEKQNIHWVKIKIQVALGDLAFKNMDWEKAVYYYQLSFDSIEGFGDKTLLQAAQEKFQEASRRI